ERFRFDARVISALGRIIESRAPDIVQTHNVKSHFLFRLSSPARRRPWIAFHHGYTTTNLKMRAYNQLDRWSLRAADRVVTVSHAFARDLARLGVRPDRIRVLHNSIDAARANGEEIREEARSLKERMRIASDERIILAVGRLSREKGHADLIDALYAFGRIHGDLRARLIVVGDGPERERLEASAARLGLADRIIWAGQVGNVRPYYAMSDLLALPSHSEGSPNVLLEAMAAKLPVVATRVGGVPEIVTHGESALLVRPGDPDAMAHAIGAVLKGGAIAGDLALRAYATVVSRHSPEARLRALLNIYGELVTEPGRGDLSKEFSRPDDSISRAAVLDREPTA
ncbi:MAG TPA: glycosyltransferase, partial [Blastocatellia bacterium]|nr:glycosyltransferase [Blastocatellia bacterium]